MTTQASPIASLTQTLPEPIQLRPPGPSRSTSSSTLPHQPSRRSLLPRVSLAIPADSVPHHLRAGLADIARNAVRDNVRIVDPTSSDPLVPPTSSSSSSWTWVVRFEHRDDLSPGQLRILAQHDDFTSLPDGQQFSIDVQYNRPIEAYRALGHILGISRSLAHFTRASSTSSSPAPGPAESQAAPREDDGGGDMDEDPAAGARSSNDAREVTWSGDVGALLRRDETCLFETVGVMIDCSRNGVLRVDSVKTLLRHMALMGSNMLQAQGSRGQLYCEDTYQIPGEPFFGYFRGPYTHDELREIDDYAFALGIEVIACIQTLGHLGQMLQWPKYGQLRDTAEVLLAESGETYAFIEKMISAISGPLRSKRIHIGMDEAHGVSEGRYRQLFGYKDSTQVFTEHLRRVDEICRAHHLEPMIWSDMLFCLPAKNNQLSGYYDPNSQITAELADSIPSGISTVFWDYYHTDSRPYTAKIAQHWQLAGKAPWMASGTWTWSRFWTALPFTFATVRASMKASKDPSAGVKHVMTTIWGDEGNECDLYSALPGMLYQAEGAYTRDDEVDAELLRRKFDAIVGADLDDWVYASKLDDTQPESQPISANSHYTPNLAKFLLWEEPFFSFLSPQYRGYDLESHYSHLASYLEQALSSDLSTMTPSVSLPHSIDDFPLNVRLRLPFLLASVLSLKCHLRERLANAYRQGDREELEALGGQGDRSRMSRLRGLVDELHALHRDNWMAMYKPFGWEVLDLRYGGLRARLETMHRRLVAYLDPADSSVTRVEELEVELETIYPNQGCSLMLDYARCSRPQYI
ncbi:glycoside hydrolase superfamily [Rhodotorula diobovata]|uniref:beta-N-acetylhexosaminidase n=1 Tax=Rhodotorula diobovata TaxID=5288 RepID=A0A5C5FVQ0_9BASI|nr:glycoside hydrolase superfamily [Rhodotorula diobovata]